MLLWPRNFHQRWSTNFVICCEDFRFFHVLILVKVNISCFWCSQNSLWLKRKIVQMIMSTSYLAICCKKQIPKISIICYETHNLLSKTEEILSFFHIKKNYRPFWSVFQSPNYTKKIHILQKHWGDISSNSLRSLV